jgi:hypothetical protein
MVRRMLLYFGGIVGVLVVASAIGLVPGLRPAAEAQVYGMTPIPPGFDVAPGGPAVEAIPADLEAPAARLVVVPAGL